MDQINKLKQNAKLFNCVGTALYSLTYEMYYRKQQDIPSPRHFGNLRKLIPQHRTLTNYSPTGQHFSTIPGWLISEHLKFSVLFPRLLKDDP